MWWEDNFRALGRDEKWNQTNPILSGLGFQQPRCQSQWPWSRMVEWSLRPHVWSVCKWSKSWRMSRYQVLLGQFGTTKIMDMPSILILWSSQGGICRGESHIQLKLLLALNPSTSLLKPVDLWASPSSDKCLGLVWGEERIPPHPGADKRSSGECGF